MHLLPACLSGDRLIEANYINSSLSALGDVMAALANKQKHVPFRNSKLTQLLADSLSGQAKVGGGSCVFQPIAALAGNAIMCLSVVLSSRSCWQQLVWASH
jgi:hypothetical protein